MWVECLFTKLPFKTAFLNRDLNLYFSVSNVASYGFLKKRLETHDLHIHALWFDIYTGDIYYFSRGAKRFLHIDEENVERIIEEVKRYYS